MIVRADISYVDYMRDLLTGELDLNCTSQHFFTKNRFLLDHRDRFGKVYWNYASTNHPRETNVGIFCIGGPQNIPHVLAQIELEPGAVASWQVPLTGTAFRLRSPQSRGSARTGRSPCSGKAAKTVY